MARTAGSHSEITGPRIRAAALYLFARHGFAAVSMRQIAAEVGIQAGAIYNYTSDKQGLLFDLMHHNLQTLLDTWAARHHPDEPLARLEQFTRFHIHHHLDKPDAVFLGNMELRNLSPENFKIIEAMRRQYESKLEQILQDGAEAGDFIVDDPRITTMAVIAMLTGVLTWYREKGRLSAEQVASVYWQLVRRAVGA